MSLFRLGDGKRINLRQPGWRRAVADGTAASRQCKGLRRGRNDLDGGWRRTDPYSATQGLHQRHRLPASRHPISGDACSPAPRADIAHGPASSPSTAAASGYSPALVRMVPDLPLRFLACAATTDRAHGLSNPRPRLPRAMALGMPGLGSSAEYSGWRSGAKADA